MKYVVLVSHGTFAPGLQSVLEMLAGGNREDVISLGLEDGMTSDAFAEKFEAAISKIGEDDEIILLGDLIGGSPLTRAIGKISELGLEKQTLVFGGMNLGMALTALMIKDDADREMLRETLITEARNAISEFVLEDNEEDDEEDDDI